MRLVLLSPAARTAIAEEAQRAQPNETGGVLVGYRQGNDLVVTDAVAISSTDATPMRYVRDDIEANTWLTTYLANRDPADPVGYIGEWHSHPLPSAPSSIDLRSIRTTARTTSGPIALIVYSPSNNEFMAATAARGRLGRTVIEDAHLEHQPGNHAARERLPDGAVDGDGPIFISYRQSDGTKRADQLEHLLRAAGLVVWRDRSDLRAGTTTDRLDRALTAGLSGAVLLVTPDIASSTIVRERELPRLLQLDNDPAFSLSIANDIPSPRDEKQPDYAAPDNLLGLAPSRTLADKKQSNARTNTGRLEIARDLLMHHIEQRRDHIATNCGVLTIAIQTRPAPSALDAGASDLHIRINPPTQGRLPNRHGLRALQATLPLTSDAIAASGAATLRVTGGMHLSAAFALGAALPATKFGRVDVVDLTGEAWTSQDADSAPLHEIVTVDIDGEFDEQPGGRSRIAVFVTLTEHADTSAFRRLIDEHPRYFTSAAHLSLTSGGRIRHHEAATLSMAVANELRRLSATSGRAEIHLAYHGPATLALLIGRQLNTLRTVIYEWDDPETSGPQYHPIVTLQPGITAGPITRVHPSRSRMDL